MAQAGFTPIQLYFSTTAAAVPTAANLAQGELAINITDGKLYYENNSGVVTLLASSATATNSFSAGTTGFTPNTATTGAVTLGGTLITSNGGTGLSSYTAGDLSYYATGTTFTKLAIGTAGQFLTSSGTAPQWSTLSGVAVTTLSFGTTGLTPATATSGAITVAGTLITSNGGTGLSSYTAGDLSYYASGTALTKLAIGTANRVMTSSGTAPQWVTSLTGLTGVSSTSFTENGFAVVSQADIGTADNEIPLNQYLGSMAYQNGTDYYNVGMTMGFRNRIINGGMTIAQRATSVSAFSGGGYQTLDRWNLFQNLGAMNIAQSSTAPTGFSNSMQFTVSTAASQTSSSTSIVTPNQSIEGFNTADLMWGTANAKSITVSVWVYSNLVGQYAIWIRNSAGDRYYTTPFTITTANTWQQVTATIGGDTSGTWVGATNGTGLTIGICLAAGSSRVGTANTWSASTFYGVTGQVDWQATASNTFYFTGFQVEVGTQATPFDFRSISTELGLCYRYCFAWRTDSLGYTQYGRFPPSFITSTTTCNSDVFLPQPMRSTAYSVTWNSKAYQEYYLTGAGATGSTITLNTDANGTNWVNVIFTFTGTALPTTQGIVAGVRLTNVTDGALVISTEL